MWRTPPGVRTRDREQKDPLAVSVGRGCRCSVAGRSLRASCPALPACPRRFALRAALASIARLPEHRQSLCFYVAHASRRANPGSGAERPVAVSVGRGSRCSVAGRSLRASCPSLPACPRRFALRAALASIARLPVHRQSLCFYVAHASRRANPGSGAERPVAVSVGRGCRCSVAGRSLRASCPSLPACPLRFALRAALASIARLPEHRQPLCFYVAHASRRANPGSGAERTVGRVGWPGLPVLRRRTVAAGILPCAPCMSAALRPPGCACFHSPAPGTPAAPVFLCGARLQACEPGIGSRKTHGRVGWSGLPVLRRRTVAAGILPFAPCMSAALRPPGCACFHSPAPGAPAAARFFMAHD